VPTSDDLKAEIIRLGPWHLDVQVTPELSTVAFLDTPPGTYEGSGALDPAKISFFNPRQDFDRLIGRIFPDGLGGRSFLDCACNCGAYCFLAREAGAGECFGFDVREHWIAQARFLSRERVVGRNDGIDFEVLDLYDLPQRGRAFDVTLFKGIFYHLPDPITGLRAAADLTRELIIVDSATRPDMPGNTLHLAYESRELLMSGVHGLNWYPSGSAVVQGILGWLGFPETRVLFEREPVDRPPIGRVRIAAARESGLLDALDG
jgi:SAM-dependent methyltransferase